METKTVTNATQSVPVLSNASVHVHSPDSARTIGIRTFSSRKYNADNDTKNINNNNNNSLSKHDSIAIAAAARPTGIAHFYYSPVGHAQYGYEIFFAVQHVTRYGIHYYD